MKVTRKELFAWLENNIEYRGFTPEEVEDMVDTWIDLVLHPPGADFSIPFGWDDLWLVYPTSDKYLEMNRVLGIALPEDMHDDFFNMCQVSKSDLVYYALSDDPICIKVVS